MKYKTKDIVIGILSVVVIVLLIFVIVGNSTPTGNSIFKWTENRPISPPVAQEADNPRVVNPESMRFTNFVLEGNVSKVDLQFYKNGEWVTSTAGIHKAEIISYENYRIEILDINRITKEVDFIVKSSDSMGDYAFVEIVKDKTFRKNLFDKDLDDFFVIGELNK